MVSLSIRCILLVIRIGDWYYSLAFVPGKTQMHDKVMNLTLIVI